MTVRTFCIERREVGRMDRGCRGDTFRGLGLAVDLDFDMGFDVDLDLDLNLDLNLGMARGPCAA
jgi:hypothetical protein